MLRGPAGGRHRDVPAARSAPGWHGRAAFHRRRRPRRQPLSSARPPAAVRPETATRPREPRSLPDYTGRMHSPSRVIPANEYRRLRWANQAGWTREIHADPGPGDWTWRVSIAELDGAAPFSPLPGVERELVLLRGEGLRLRFADGAAVDLGSPHGRLRFDGGRVLAGEPEGRCEVFNLMWRRDTAGVQLWHRPLTGAMLVFTEPGSTWIVHLLGGHARIGADAALPALAAGDTALLRAQDRRARYVIDGGGEVLLARIDAAAC